jgi:hypothetical protein
MAISYTSPTTIYGPTLVPVLRQIFFENRTVANNWVTFNDNMKAGTIITESTVVVTAQAYTGAALSNSGSITLADRAVLLTKLEYKQTFLDENIRTSRFNETMKKGAWEIESNEFNTKVLGIYAPLVSADAENLFWGGVLAATKTAVAALTPNAAQGSITAAAQTAFGTLTAGLIDGIFAKAFYDNGAIGGYIKVTGTTVTSGNIAGEIAKIFAAIPAQCLNQASQGDPVIIYCPRAWKQLVYNANNTVGAAQQINFLIEGNDFATSRVFYNGVELVFVPVPKDLWAYANNVSSVMWNCDSVDDVNKVEIGKVANDGDTRFIRSIYTMHTHIARATNGVLYGG